MQNLTKFLALILAAGLTMPAHAQDAETPSTDAPATEAPATEAPATEAPETEAPAPDEAPAGDAPTSDAGDLSLGQEVGGAGSTYTAETHGEWEVRCVRAEDGSDPCQLYQLLKDGEGNSVAEISLFGLPEGQQAAAGATIVTPLETLLTQQITLKVDAAAPKRYPFTWCSPIGCVARVGFTGEEVNALKRGNQATLTIVPMAAPDQQVDLDISLSGFTAGYDAVEKANAPE